MSDYTEKPKAHQYRSGTYFLDPDYHNFTPGVTQLKFETLFDSKLDLIIGCISLIGCLPMTLVFAATLLFMLMQFMSFQSDGINTEAIVETCDFHLANGRGNNSVDLTYRYTVANREYTAQDLVINNYLDCEDVPVGSTVQIRYLNSNPEDSRVVDGDIIRSPLEDTCLNLGIIFTFFFCLFSVGWSFSNIYRFLKAKIAYPRLLKSSVLLTGEIVKAYGREHGKNGGNYQLHILYRFESPNGKMLNRWQKKRRNDLKGIDAPPAETPVTILYADDHCHVML